MLQRQQAREALGLDAEDRDVEGREVDIEELIRRGDAEGDAEDDEELIRAEKAGAAEQVGLLRVSMGWLL